MQQATITIKLFTVGEFDELTDSIYQAAKQQLEAGKYTCDIEHFENIASASTQEETNPNKLNVGDVIHLYRKEEDPEKLLLKNYAQITDIDENGEMTVRIITGYAFVRGLYLHYLPAKDYARVPHRQYKHLL